MRRKRKYMLPALAVAAAVLGAVIWRHESMDRSALPHPPVKVVANKERNLLGRNADRVPQGKTALPADAGDSIDAHPMAPPVARQETAPALREAARNPEAWMAHAAPPHNAGPAPVIAIVMDDVGVNTAQLAGVLGLPAAVTLSILPYAPDAAGIAARAHTLGHEVLVHLPMEADGGEDPGPRALRHGQSPEAFSANLEWNLSRFTGFVGVNNHMGSRLTQDPAAMEVLQRNLYRRGVLFLDSRTTAGTVAAGIARANGVTTLERDVFLDNSPVPEKIQAQLRKTEAKARRQGYAIAIGHPHAATIGAVGAWAKNLRARGFSLVPLTSVTRITSGPQTVARH